MTCAEARDLLGDVADGRLAPDELVRWDAHLAACAECRLEWASFRHTLDLLHGLPQLRAPDGFVRRVMAAAYPESRSRRLARRLFVPLRLKLPLEAAALALVAIGAAVYLAPRTLSLHTTAVREDAIRRHEPAPPTAPPRGPSATGAPDAMSTPKVATPDGPVSAERPGAAARADRGEVMSPSRPEPAPPSTHAQLRATHEAAGPPPPARSRDDGAVTLEPSGPPPDLVGRLVVEDPAAAGRALGALTRRLGVSEVGRAGGEDGLVVELDVPRAQYAEFARGLAHLGRWTPGEERADSGPALRVRVTVVRPPAR